MNDCLTLPVRQGIGGPRLLTGWEALRLPLGEGEEKGLPMGNGRGWEPTQVPGQQSGFEGSSAVWYRTTFARPDHTGRVLLRFGGAFLATHAWLNGRLLGGHYGYFGPFGFDVTPYLKSENLLVTCCESPVETDLSRKRHIMGIFSDGDSRPYPGSAYFSLPPGYRWEVPLGLWGGVELEYVGPVMFDWLRLKPRLEAGDVGRLEVEARLRNLDGREMSGDVSFEVLAPQGPPLRLRRQFRLAGGIERTFGFQLSVPEARRWWPWRFGEAVLYRAQAGVNVEGRPSSQVQDHFGFRDLEVRASPAEGWSIRVNGQPMFLRGANYTPDLHLDRLSSERFRADLALARETNLDALRVHGHVLPDEFYRCADEAGMLVVADFPLTLAYGYHASTEEASFFDSAVREQVPEMVELLRNRPSVAWWVAHDDPPWIAANGDQGDVHAVRQNYSIDHEAKALFERLDSRLALAASGDLDSHLYLGWRHSSWARFGEVDPWLVSEFGAQALPELDSPVWRQMRSGQRWPVGDAEPDWLYAGFQPVQWSDSVGLPSDHSRLETLVQASGEYQAWLVRYAADQLRKRKFEPCWGAFVYQLVDAFPGIGFGLADFERIPKAGLASLRQAFAPTRVILDPVDFEIEGSRGIRFQPGRLAIRVVVVNDDPELIGPARIRWWVERERGGDGGALGWLREIVRRKSYSGTAEFDLPEAWEPAVQLESVELPQVSEGSYRVEVELLVEGRTIDTARLDFRVGQPQPAKQRRRPMPDYLSRRLVEVTSLAAENGTLCFGLHNRARPAVLGSIGQFLLDGHPLPGPRVNLEGGIPLPRRLELPVGREIRLYVESAQPLTDGLHRLEFHLVVPGVASGVVAVEGTLTEGMLAQF